MSIITDMDKKTQYKLLTYTSVFINSYTSTFLKFNFNTDNGFEAQQPIA